MFVSLDEPFTEVTGLSELTGLVGLTKLVLVLECFAQVSANTLSSGAFCQNYLLKETRMKKERQTCVGLG